VQNPLRWPQLTYSQVLDCFRQFQVSNAALLIRNELPDLGLQRIGMCIAANGAVDRRSALSSRGGEMTRLKMHWQLIQGADGRKHLDMLWEAVH